MTTTTFSPAAALVALADSLPAGRTAQFESKIREARQGTLPESHAAMVLRQLGGMSSPAETEAARPARSNPTGQNASTRSDDASDAQRNYAMDLLRTRVAADERVPGTVKTAAQVIAMVSACDRMSKGMARSVIDAYKDRPRVQVARQAAPQAPKAARVEREAGIYRVDDTFYKVQKAVHGSGRMYAKRLVVHGPGDASFEYDGGAIRKITPDHRVTLEEAKKFGHVYGVCCNCGATLTDEKSIEAGIGPVCAKKF